MFQVLEMTSNVIVCVNLIDEAKKKGIYIDDKKLSSKLGVPVVKISARNKVGIEQLLNTLDELIRGNVCTSPYQMTYSDEMEEKIVELESKIIKLFGNNLPTRWIALRIIDGDEKLLEKLKKNYDLTQSEVTVSAKQFNFNS